MSAHTQKSSISLGLRIGIAAVFLFAAFATASAVNAAGIISTGAEPLSGLIKFEDREYEVQYSQAVSLNPISTATVRKIGYGQSREISIATTSTGTYSSEGLVSPHFRYPGISVTPVRTSVQAPFAGPGSVLDQLVPEGTHFSILSIGQSPNGGIVVNSVNDLGLRSCLARGSIVSCFRTY